MHKGFKLHLFTALLVAIAGIFVLTIVNYHQIDDSGKNSGELKKKQDQLSIAYRILIDLQNMETGQRGFLLTKDTKFLSSFDQGLMQLITDTQQLRKIEPQIFHNQKFTEELSGLVRQKTVQMKTMVGLGKEGFIDSARKLVQEGVGLMLMNEIRSRINDFEKHQSNELALLQVKIKQISEDNLSRVRIITLAFIVVIILSFYLIVLDYKKISTQNAQMAFHSALIENISDAVISSDTNYILNDWNKDAERILGYTREEAIGKNVIDFLKIETLGIPLSEIIDTFWKNNRWNGDLIIYHKNGNPVILEFSSSVIFNKKGKKIGIVTVFRDVTEQKENQNRLEALSKMLETDIKQKMEELTISNEELTITRDRFYMISNATNQSIWDWEMSTNKIWGNKAYIKLLGKTEGDWINFEDFVSRISKEDNEKIASLFEKAVANKEKQFQSAFQFNHLDGRTTYFISKSYIIYNEKGDPVRCLGGLTDVTMQENVQQQILKEKELSDSLINSLPGVFYMFNKDGKYLRWNKNILAVSGYNEEELKNMKPLDFVPEENREALLDKIQNVFVNGTDTVESLFLTKDGSKIPYYFTGSYIKYNNEDCLMGVGYDMTEKLMYQQQLKDLANHLQNVREEEQSRISREIHDELGQQLTGIKLQLSMLKKQHDRGDNHIGEKLNELLQLVDDTIQSTRRISIQLRPSILDDLGLISAIEWLIEDLRKKTEMEITYTHKIQDIYLDTVMSSSIFRIFQESMTNVIRHAQATLLQVSVNLNKDFISLVIQDNGKGFDVKTLHREKTLGILGMKERAEMIGARLDIVSMPNEGTTITLRKTLHKNILVS